MRVLIYASGADTGGQGYRIATAFQRYTDWDVESLAGGKTLLAYPETRSVRGTMLKTTIKDLWAAADVVHLRNNLSGWQVFDRGQGKPVVLHHHGTQFREGHGGIASQAREVGAVQVAATLDLTLLEPDVEWVPSPYHLASLQGIRTEHRLPLGDRPVRIAHFPTSTGIKSTDEFMAATSRLSERYRIEVITNLDERGRSRHMPWAEVMAAKASADIYYDQVILGYGNNAIEAWGMGIPVVAGTSHPVLGERTRALMVERFGQLPFVEATPDTIQDALERLIQSEQMRAEYAAIGLAHVERFHDDGVVVSQLQDIYRNAPRTRPVVLPRPSPGWVARKHEARQRRQERMDIRERLRAARVA